MLLDYLKYLFYININYYNDCAESYDVLDLPDDVMILILNQLTSEDIISFLSTCKCARNLIPLFCDRFRFPSIMPIEYHQYFIHMNVVHETKLENISKNLKTIKYTSFHNIWTTDVSTKYVGNVLPNYRKINIPNWVEEVIFGDFWDAPVNIPQGPTKLTFGDGYRQKTIIPSGVKNIKFGHYYDQDTVLTDGVESISFGDFFKSKVNLPEGLKYIKFGWAYSPCGHELVLPSTTEEVIFGASFNCSVILNEGLKRLKFGQTFNRYIQLPRSLEEVEFGAWYKRPTVLYSTIKKYKFGQYYDDRKLTFIE
jgi:hypothetical protein